MLNEMTSLSLAAQVTRLRSNTPWSSAPAKPNTPAYLARRFIRSTRAQILMALEHQEKPIDRNVVAHITGLPERTVSGALFFLDQSGHINRTLMAHGTIHWKITASGIQTLRDHGL